jgi:hypothetical protein
MARPSESEFPVYEDDRLVGKARSWWSDDGAAMVEFTPPLPSGYKFRISGVGREAWFEIWRAP